MEARVVIPINHSIALTAEASYDKIQGGAIVGGIRLQNGHPQSSYTDSRYFEPVTRNLGTNGSGLGIPVAHGTLSDGFYLFRDNIWFFAGQGGSAFTGLATGTFENPLSRDQLTQTTVNSIFSLTPYAKLFFNTGNYVLNPLSATAPNATLILPAGQSIYGRTLNYKCSAIGIQRPTFLGEMELVGNNKLDSITLVNNLTLPQQGSAINLTALAILNAPNVSICNSRITSQLSVVGNNIGSINVSGLSPLNSAVIIDRSEITALSILGGNNGINASILVTAIGNNNQPTSSNLFQFIPVKSLLRPQ